MSAPLVAGVACARPECGHGEDLHDGICFGTACECVRFVESAGALPMPAGPAHQGLDLDACVSRALRVARQYDGPDGVDQDDLDRLTDVDVPRLVAEVRAGRIELEKARAQIANHGPVLAALGRERARVAELEAQRERRRVRLVALSNDALSMRGSLSPMGEDRKVPFPLGETLTPAVDWLIGRVAELEAERHSTNEALDDAVQALRAVRFFLADVDGGDPTLWPSEKAAQKHCVAVLGSELEGRSFRWAPVGDGVSQVRFTDEPAWGSAKVWPLPVTAAGEDGCTCPETDRVEPHWSGCPEEDAPCPVDGPIPGVGVGAGAPEMRALRAALYGPPDGEHWAAVHHSYRVPRDLPETGGQR